MRACSSPLRASDLDRLRRGTTFLTVPIVGDVVQVGIGGEFTTTTVAVSVTATSVRVHRLDGKRLQVHIVEDWRDSADPGVATPVFDAPVEALVLERCGGRWVPGPGMRDRLTDLDRFVGTLTRFALAKQGRAVDQAVGAA
ncbi:hypothetical protein VST63_28970 [Mycolicibacterium sp. 050232]|uniref:hypothetical protein n=1 Tax=Mycolicibacterium sp. 050232 TaxID=3113982 RepID=UPI002E2A057D|nr:hypothetical protein [Mycolicibacterium sp. 050232]MED5816412.1 hypothetical protein [Mycolicibacterium sp. 050232]